MASSRSNGKKLSDKQIVDSVMELVQTLPEVVKDLPAHLRDVGYILSTSLRESCPVGVLEGVASGAVPVVREWPVFARLDAAHQLFPERFVFNTAAEAATIIEANRAERMGRAAEAKEDMADLFSVEHTEGRLVEAILGRA